MKVGTKGWLIGIHQFVIHPTTVFLSWCELYGLPNIKEMFCIFIHDIGYIGKDNVDGDEGKMHPELGAKIAGNLFGEEYKYLCAGHSREYAKLKGIKPSKLCWADKYCMKYDGGAFRVWRGTITGELAEYHTNKNITIYQEQIIWLKDNKPHIIKNAYKESRKFVAYKEKNIAKNS